MNESVVFGILLMLIGIGLMRVGLKEGLNMLKKSPWFSSNCEISDADECADDEDDDYDSD